jgi:2-keto-4-pentenoate hydratase
MTSPTGAKPGDSNKVDAVASALIDARTSGAPIEELAGELQPADIDEAQRIDDRVAELSGWKVQGWKIGCTSVHAQEVLGSPGPIVGRVYSVLESGAELNADQLMAEPSIEGEFAMVLGRDISPEDDLDRAAVIAAVAEVRPAIELVGGRFTRFVGLPLPTLVADASGNSHLVLGPQAEGFDPERLVTSAGTMTVDGVVAGQGTGADVLGDPINALEWLVAHLKERGITLSAGQVITTGTLTQLAALPAGATATASFDGVGEVTLSRAR